MRRHHLFVLPLFACVVLIYGCKSKDQETNPTDFPRKQLIEMFTDQDSPYCPQGTEQIDEAVEGNESKYVRLNYYYGSTYDDFTIYYTKNLAKELGVELLPSMLYNRSLWDWDDEGTKESGKVMHPYFFNQFISRPSSKADVSVNVSTTYDASTRMSSIKVSGKTLSGDTDLTLTIILKESGLHARQLDASRTWEGWEDYVHNNVVRNFLNTYKGQVLEFNGADYEVSMDYELYESYNADNCSVVAFLTDNTTGEVINAAETPLVSGTDGGASFKTEGIKAVKVPETYPETMALPANYSNVEYLTAQYYLSNYKAGGNNVVEIMMLSTELYTYKRAQYIPVATLYIVVDNDGSTLPVGTFELSSSGKPNTALAGTKVEEKFTYYGSEMFLADYSLLNKGYLKGFEWLLASGSITISESSVSYEATTLSGNKVKGSFTGTITHFTGEEAPGRRADSRSMPLSAGE